MTSDRLAAVWPQVSERLMRLLDKRGLTPTQAEDVCQDVAVRVLASGVTFDTAEDLYRWAAHVARNLHVDLLRATSRVQCDEETLHAMQADTDVEHEVERRIALSKVLRHWLSLRPSDQAALLEGMYADADGDRSDAVRRAVRRHRARQRLRLLAKGAFGWTVVLKAQSVRRTSRLMQTASVAAVAPLVMISAGPFEFATERPHVDIQHRAQDSASARPLAPATAAARPVTRAKAVPPHAAPAPVVTAESVAAPAKPAARKPVDSPSELGRGAGLGTYEAPGREDMLLCVDHARLPEYCVVQSVIPPGKILPTVR